MALGRRWDLGRLSRSLAALLVVGTIVIAQGAGWTTGLASAPSAPLHASAGQPSSEPVANQGAYRLGKVRILGVPVITVASPVLSRGGEGPGGRIRARVIEGNLAMLYRTWSLCSGGEALAELLVDSFLVRGNGERACGLANANLLGKPEALSVVVVPGEGGVHRLEAKVEGRAEPLPLLTVTPEDASLNGLENGVLAHRWQSVLQRHLRLARTLLQPEVLQRRWAHVAMAEGVLVVVLAVVLCFWRLTPRWVGRLEDRFGVEAISDTVEIRGLCGEVSDLGVLSTELRGVTAQRPDGVTMGVSLVTVAGSQGPASREVRLRWIERLREEGIPLAEPRS